MSRSPSCGLCPHPSIQTCAPAGRCRGKWGNLTPETRLDLTFGTKALCPVLARAVTVATGTGKERLDAGVQEKQVDCGCRRGLSPSQGCAMGVEVRWMGQWRGDSNSCGDCLGLGGTE